VCVVEVWLFLFVSASRARCGARNGIIWTVSLHCTVPARHPCPSFLRRGDLDFWPAELKWYCVLWSPWVLTPHIDAHRHRHVHHDFDQLSRPATIIMHENAVYQIWTFFYDFSHFM